MSYKLWSTYYVPPLILTKQYTLNPHKILLFYLQGNWDSFPHAGRWWTKVIMSPTWLLMGVAGSISKQLLCVDFFFLRPSHSQRIFNKVSSVRLIKYPNIPGYSVGQNRQSLCLHILVGSMGDHPESNQSIGKILWQGLSRTLWPVGATRSAWGESLIYMEWPGKGSQEMAFGLKLQWWDGIAVWLSGGREFQVKEQQGCRFGGVVGSIWKVKGNHSGWSLAGQGLECLGEESRFFPKWCEMQ